MARPAAVLAIAGMTASGKSELGLALARSLGAEMITADSAQVYRGLDIGTDKPTRAVRAQVAHHLLDVRAPGETFSVADYVCLAETAVVGIVARGAVPLLVGGTGLYVRQFLNGPQLAPVPPRPELRAELEALSTAELHAELERRDPESAGRIHPHNRQRLVRALEVCLASGRPFSAFRQSEPQSRRPHLLVVLDRPSAVLRRRIAARVDRMLQGGLVSEVQGLLAAGVPAEAQAMQALGYRQTVRWLEHPTSLGALREDLVSATWAYARRQRTWFRRDTGALWLDLGEHPAEAALERVLKAWAGTVGGSPPQPSA